jgi:hypothetical protein
MTKPRQGGRSQAAAKPPVKAGPKKPAAPKPAAKAVPTSKKAAPKADQKQASKASASAKGASKAQPSKPRVKFASESAAQGSSRAPPKAAAGHRPGAASSKAARGDEQHSPKASARRGAPQAAAGVAAEFATPTGGAQRASPTKSSCNKRQRLLHSGSEPQNKKAARRLDLDAKPGDMDFGGDEDKSGKADEKSVKAEVKSPPPLTKEEKILQKLRAPYEGIVVKRVGEADVTQKVDSCLLLDETDPDGSTCPVVIPDRDEDPNEYRIDGSDCKLEVPQYKAGQDGSTCFLVTLTTIPTRLGADDFLRMVIRALRAKKNRPLVAAVRAELGKLKESLHYHCGYMCQEVHRFAQLRLLIIKMLRAWEKAWNARTEKDFSPNFKELPFEVSAAYITVAARLRWSCLTSPAGEQ